MRFASVSFVLMMSAAHAQDWNSLPPFPSTSRDDAANFTIGTDVFVGTGMEVGWNLTQDWWRYSVASAQWQPVASLPAAPREHAAAWSANGKGFVFGGFGNGNVYLNDLWMYDPQLDTWSARAPLPAPGRHSCAAFIIGTRAYVVLGRYGPGSALTNETWSYDMETDAWTQMADYPGASRLLSAAFADGVHGFVVGGQDTAATGVNDVFMYDPDPNTWSPRGMPPWEGRFGASGCFGTTHAFLLGGTHAYDPCCMDAAWSYDVANDDWIALPELPNGDRKGAVCSFLPGLGLFFGTGIQGDSLRHSDCWSLNADVGVQERGNGAASVFPDPGASTFRIEVPVPGRSTVTITDANGRVVLATNIRLPHTFDLEDNCRGLYLIRITDAQGNIHHLRWIKE